MILPTSKRRFFLFGLYCKNIPGCISTSLTLLLPLRSERKRYCRIIPNFISTTSTSPSYPSPRCGEGRCCKTFPNFTSTTSAKEQIQALYFQIFKLPHFQISTLPHCLIPPAFDPALFIAGTAGAPAFGRNIVFAEFVSE